jgi:DNA repair protein RecO (recombination protein O)
MTSGRNAAQQTQSGFVLHTYPYKETSLVIEVFARESGRVGLVARGARRPKSALRGLLMPFQPLLFSWLGKAELGTLRGAEWQGGIRQLEGLALMCGFYLNELLLKFLAREDPHEILFDGYRQAVAELAAKAEPSATLRKFEKRLLDELGYALTLDHDVVSGRPIEPGLRYTYLVDKGPVALSESITDGIAISGKALHDLARDRYDEPDTLAQIKLLMRHLINHHLGNQELYTRQFLRELQQL